jgi:hypothetical protein
VGHVWLIAPPFKVVDVALTRQGFPDDETRLLPPIVLAEEVEGGKPYDRLTKPRQEASRDILNGFSEN